MRKTLKLCFPAVRGYHPTRWARNTEEGENTYVVIVLSPSHTVGLEQACLVSLLCFEVGHHPTRWARNKEEEIWDGAVVHVIVTIPHGGLGTMSGADTSHKTKSCHHPTRWARNSIFGRGMNPYATKMSPSHTVGSEQRGVQLTLRVFHTSPSHTVGSEPQITTLNKIRHINHFVKVVPLSNEVNFPKSEIMQS